MERVIATLPTNSGCGLVVIPSVFSGARLRALPYGLRALEKLPAPVARALKKRVAP